MPAIDDVIKNRFFVFICGCIAAIAALQFGLSSMAGSISSFSPLLFPTLTIFLLVFHLFIACFMAMRYWCDRRRLYLVALAFAFAGSSCLMVGTLSSFPAWFELYQFTDNNYNDAMIFFMFRHLMMAVLIIAATVLYTLRHQPLSRTIHLIVIGTVAIFTTCMIILAWCYSSHCILFGIDLVDNETRQFMMLWDQVINIILIMIWLVAFTTMMVITRLRNLFWVSGTFLCLSYLVSLSILLFSGQVEGLGWYQARIFETTATLLIIFVLLCDVFSLYRDSNSRYQQSYQNAIRDALTRLYNRSYFYDALKQALKTASDVSPVSVIVSDLDRFKRINDTYGHLQGDKVLQFVATLLTESVRPQDIAARIGGEEFVLLLTHTASADAHQVAERIRVKLNGYDRATSNNQLPEKISISMGVYTATSAQVTEEECVERADKAMYQAKETGRNRVVVWQ